MVRVDACAPVQQMTDLPSIENLIPKLQVCRKSNATHATKLYINLCNGGLDMHTQIANYLILPLAECESLFTAERIFNKLLYRNESCWTSLMHAHVERGQSQYALSLLKKMEDEHVQTSKHTLSVLLKASAKLRRVKEGQELHAMIIEEGFESDNFVGISLMNMYAKCGLLAYAREVFNELSTQDVISWTTLIAGYSEYGDDAQALSCLEQMQKEGLVPDEVAFACGLKACGAIRCAEKGCRLHTEVMQEGMEGDSYVRSSLVYMYAECGLLLEAQEAFKDSLTQDVFTWNALLFAHAKEGLADNVLEWLDQMRLEGVSPDGNSYACGLQACKNVKAVERGQEIHSDVIKVGLENEDAIINNLVDMYMGCELSAEAEEVFRKVEGRDISLWNALLAGYLEDMQIEKVLNSFEQMLAEGMFPNAVAFVCSLKASGFWGRAGNTQVIHTLITKAGMERDFVLCGSLITVYGECGLLLEAQEMFDRLPERQETLWNTLLTVFVRHELTDEVLRCLEEMFSEGVSPTASSLVYGLKASGILKATNKGRELHHQVVRQGFDNEVFVGNTLIDLYSKLGALAEVQQVFDGLNARDVVTWTTLIAAYTEHGSDDEALDCLKKMQECEVSPNSVTYIFTMKASSNIGAIDKGQEIHSQVIKKGLEKGSYICGTLVDMYVEFGLLADALAVFDERPAEALASWNTLIRGYADHDFGEDALGFLEQMQLEGIVMDPFSYVCGLKACIVLEDIEKGRELYADILKYGFDGDLLVGNMLLDLYAKHGSEEEMSKIFSILPEQDVISWSTLIAGYNKHGLSEKVIGCLEQMELEGISPNGVTFMSSLQACEGQEFLERGQQLHAEIVSDGCEGDSLVNSCLVYMYCRYGLLAEALDVFDEQPIHDVVSWNTLMSGYAEQEMDKEVLNCLQTSHLECVIPNAATFTCGLKACGSIGNIELGRELHMQLVLKGFDKSANAENAVMDMYLKCGLFLEAQKVFDVLSVPNVIPWTMLMAGYVENGLGEEAMDCIEQMSQHSVLQDVVTLACSLRACGIVESLEKGQHFHAEIVSKGFEKDSFVWNALVDMYAKCGSLAEVEELFNKLLVHDIRSWSAHIVGYAEHGLDEKVLECFESMQVDGISPDTFMFMSFLKASGGTKALERGQSLHADACKLGFSGDPLVENALVDMYARCDAFVEAQEVFNRMRSRDTNSWNALIAAYTEHNCNEEVLECLQRMQVQGSIPNLVSYHNIFKACGNVGALYTGQELLSRIVKEGLGNDLMYWSGMKAVGHGRERDKPRADVGVLMLGNACIDMLGKCGNMMDAMQVFDAMASRDQVTWNALIWGYARQGQQDHVFSLLGKMKEEGLHPDKVTTLGVLNLCSHLGLLHQSQDYLETFANKSNGVLSLEHLNCLLDLLGRAGQLNEAFEVLERVSFLPDFATWATLLGACRSCRNELLSRQVLECAVKSHEKDAGTLVLISNIYAEVEAM